MNTFRMRFIVGITEADLLALNQGERIVCKMLLIPDDYKAFHYAVGDDIEVETPEGNRLWGIINSMEIIEDDYRTIVILTISKAPSENKAPR
jgi:hypothetical protein